MEKGKTLSDCLTQEIIDKAFLKIQSDPEFAVPGCHYETASDNRRQALLDFGRDQYWPDEPLSRSIVNLCPWTDVIEALWVSVINWSISLLLVSDTTDQIVAVRISHVAKKAEPWDIDSIESDGLKKILGIIFALNKLCDVYDHYHVDEYIGFFALGVHKNYRRQGIGLKIQQAAVAMVKNFEIGPILVKVEATSNFSKKIFEGLGFDNLAELFYENHKENGEVVFKNMGDHKSVILYARLVG